MKWHPRHKGWRKECRRDQEKRQTKNNPKKKWKTRGSHEKSRSKKMTGEKKTKKRERTSSRGRGFSGWTNIKIPGVIKVGRDEKDSLQKEEEEGKREWLGGQQFVVGHDFKERSCASKSEILFLEEGCCLVYFFPSSSTVCTFEALSNALERWGKRERDRQRKNRRRGRKKFLYAKKQKISVFNSRLLKKRRRGEKTRKTLSKTQENSKTKRKMHRWMQ